MTELKLKLKELRAKRQVIARRLWDALKADLTFEHNHQLVVSIDRELSLIDDEICALTGDDDGV